MIRRIFPHEDRIFMRFDPMLESKKITVKDLQKIIDNVSFLPQAGERMVEAHDLADDYFPDITKMEESVSAKYGKFKQGGGVIKRFRKYLNQYMEGIEVTDVVFSKPRKNGIFVFVTAQFKISDGQTITAYFYAPEAEKAALKPTDLLVSYRFTINKLDVTGAIVRSTGKDLPAPKMAMIIGSLVSENKENFASKKAAREERAAQLATLQTKYDGAIAEAEGLMGELSQLEVQDQDISQEKESLTREVTNLEFQLQDLQNQIASFGRNKQPAKEEVDLQGEDKTDGLIPIKGLPDFGEENPSEAKPTVNSKIEPDPIVDDKGEVTLEGIFLSDGWAVDKKSKVPGFIKVVDGDKYKLNIQKRPQFILVKNRKNLQKFNMRGTTDEAIKEYVDGIIQREEDLKAKMKDHDDQLKKATVRGLELASEALSKLGWEPTQTIGNLKKDFSGKIVKLFFDQGSTVTSLIDNQVKSVGIELKSIRIDEERVEVPFGDRPKENYNVAKGKLDDGVGGAYFAKEVEDFIIQKTGLKAGPVPEPVAEPAPASKENDAPQASVDAVDPAKETPPANQLDADSGSNAVTVANDILGGKYDENPADLEAAFESILDDLDQSNPELLERVSNYYTNILVAIA